MVFFCLSLLINSLSIAFQNYLIPKAVLHDNSIWVYFYLSIAFQAFSSTGRYTLFSSVRSILLPTTIILASYGQFVTAYSSHADTLLCEAYLDKSYTRTTMSASMILNRDFTFVMDRGDCFVSLLTCTVPKLVPNLKLVDLTVIKAEIIPNSQYCIFKKGISDQPLDQRRFSCRTRTHKTYLHIFVYFFCVLF